MGTEGERRELTADERALYDRQIRLWGAEAQGRLSCGRMLVVGDTACGLAQEIAKNVVLAGVARVTFCPTRKDSTATTTTSASGFLGGNMEEMCESLRAMNPLVKIAVSNEADVGDADVVCSIRGTSADDTALSKRCAAAGVPFLCGRVCGLLGWIYFDLGHEFTYTEGSKPPANISYPTLAAALAAPWGGEPKRSVFGWHLASALLKYEEEFARMPNDDTAALSKVYRELGEIKKATRTAPQETVDLVAKTSGVELPALNAIVGGVWGREVVKILCRNDPPLNNLFFYDANTSVGAVETVGAPKSA